MNTFTSRVVLAIAAATLLIGISLAPALAEDGSQDQPNVTATPHPEATATPTIKPTEMEHSRPTSTPRPSSVEQHHDQLMEKAKSLVASAEAFLNHQDNHSEDEASHEAELKLRQASLSAELKEKLAGVRLKACEDRQRGITTATSNTLAAAEKMLTKLEGITQKAQNFKTSRNISLDTYDALIATITADDAASQAAITTAKSSAANFSCTSDGPKAQLHTFVTNMDAVRASLKTYRADVRALLVALKQAAPQASASATPEGL